MLSLGDLDAPRRLRIELRDRFLNEPGQQSAQRTVTYPGGNRRCIVTWLPERPIWAAFPDSSDRWLCYFGVSLPNNEQTPVTMDVEINLSAYPGDRRLRGRALVDGEGRLYLGHRGGLGGGRGGQIRIPEFAQRIRGFEPQEIMRPNDANESVFIIGTPQSGDFLENLRSYVSECARLRQEARHQR